MLVNIGKGITLDLDATTLPAPVMQHVVMIGLRNILMDCHAGITKVDNPLDYVALSREKAGAKWAAMVAGNLRVARQSSGVSRDPVRAEALAMARKIVGAVFYFAAKDSTWKVRDAGQFAEIKAALGDEYDFGQDGLRDVWDYLVDAQADECMEAAEAAVAARNSIKPVGLAGLVRKA